MSRRIALPGADELFRSTGDPARPASEEADLPGSASSPHTAPEGDGRLAGTSGGPPLAPLRAVSAPERAYQPGSTAPAADEIDDTAPTRPVARRRPRSVADRRPTGRERHEEKITVYVSPDELMDLEHARLTLRGDFGLSADRGRLVREALAVVLADLEAKGESSILVRRLRGR